MISVLDPGVTVGERKRKKEFERRVWILIYAFMSLSAGHTRDGSISGCCKTAVACSDDDNIVQLLFTIDVCRRLDDANARYSFDEAG